MARIPARIVAKARRAAALCARHGRVSAAYLFGSWVAGTAHEYSDVDVAVFVDVEESWDLRRRAQVSAEVQRDVGDDVEVHFFPSTAALSPAPASFASEVVTHGRSLDGSLGAPGAPV